MRSCVLGPGALYPAVRHGMLPHRGLSASAASQVLHANAACGGGADADAGAPGHASVVHAAAEKAVEAALAALLAEATTATGHGHYHYQQQCQPAVASAAAAAPQGQGPAGSPGDYSGTGHGCLSEQTPPAVVVWPPALTTDVPRPVAAGGGGGSHAVTVLVPAVLVAGLARVRCVVADEGEGLLLLDEHAVLPGPAPPGPPRPARQAGPGPPAVADSTYYSSGPAAASGPLGGDPPAAQGHGGDEGDGAIVAIRCATGEGNG